MDPAKQRSSSSSPRKMKFTPKPPRNRNPKLPATKTEAEDEQPDQDVLRHRNLQDPVARARRQPQPKVETKPSVQVAFGPGGSSRPPRKSAKRSGSASEYVANEQDGLTHSSAAIEDQSDTSMKDVSDDDKEPWVCETSGFPILLPMRKPGSGDPEILNEKEYGDAATGEEYDENDKVNAASELDLLGKSEHQRMIYFQLPPLPLEKQSVSRKGKEKAGTSTVSKGSSAFEGMPEGYMGKMLVYKSGKVKLKLGENLYDVSPGTNCIAAQDVVAMNVAQKQCCVLGELSGRAVVTPELDFGSLGL